MQIKTFHFKKDFQVAIGNRRSQAAEMVIAVGDSEGGPGNRHRGSDQWLFVISGQGVAIVDQKKHVLKKGTLILIERGEHHEIRNTGRTPLRTLSIHVPPAFSKSGEPLPRGRA